MTVAIFPTADEMRDIFAPVVRDAAVQLGSVADLYSETPTRQDDGTYEDVPSLVAPNLNIRLTAISSEVVLNTFGEHPSIAFQGSMMRDTGTVAEVVEGKSVFSITSGDFEGRWFRVVKVIEKQYSDSYVLGLAHSEPIL